MTLILITVYENLPQNPLPKFWRCVSFGNRCVASEVLAFQTRVFCHHFFVYTAIAHFLHLFGLPERVRENRQRNAQADSDFIIALVALWVLRVEVLSFQLILECQDLN